METRKRCVSPPWPVVRDQTPETRGKDRAAAPFPSATDEQKMRHFHPNAIHAPFPPVFGSFVPVPGRTASRGKSPDPVPHIAVAGQFRAGQVRTSYPSPSREPGHTRCRVPRWKHGHHARPLPYRGGEIHRPGRPFPAVPNNPVPPPHAALPAMDTRAKADTGRRLPCGRGENPAFPFLHDADNLKARPSCTAPSPSLSARTRYRRKEADIVPPDRRPLIDSPGLSIPPFKERDIRQQTIGHRFTSSPPPAGRSPPSRTIPSRRPMPRFRRWTPAPKPTQAGVSPADGARIRRSLFSMMPITSRLDRPAPRPRRACRRGHGIAARKRTSCHPTVVP